jgi:hypothetical protein
MEKRKGSASGIDPLSDANNLLPERVHPALADYATYRILMNGNALRQQRSRPSFQFRGCKDSPEKRERRSAESENGGNWRFTGLYDN